MKPIALILALICSIAPKSYGQAPRSKPACLFGCRPNDQNRQELLALLTRLIDKIDSKQGPDPALLSTLQQLAANQQQMLALLADRGNSQLSDAILAELRSMRAELRPLPPQQPLFPQPPQQPLYPAPPQNPLYPGTPQQPLYPAPPQQPLYPQQPSQPQQPQNPLRPMPPATGLQRYRSAPFTVPSRAPQVSEVIVTYWEERHR